jgi:hypothetical protein
MGSPIEEAMRFTRTAALAAFAAFALPAVAAAQTGPAWKPTHLSPDVLSLLCAPAITYEVPAVPLRITGGQALDARVAWAPGDLVTINAGRNNGIQVGQEFFVRRLQKERDQIVSRETPGTVRTTGWIRVYAVDDEMSLVTIQYACDSVEPGDYLEPFAMPTAIPRAPKTGKPEKGNYARVLSGSDRRQSFSAGEFIVIDRGKDYGIVPGSQFVVYHDKKEPGNFLYEVADAVAVDVRDSSATLHLTFSRTAVIVNDYVSMRK